MDALDIIRTELGVECSVDQLTSVGFEIVEEDGFVALVRGPEFHFASAQEGRSLSRRVIREFLDRIISVHGFAQTKTPRGDFRQRRFNERLGFTPIDEDHEYVTYRIKRCP